MSNILIKLVGFFGAKFLKILALKAVEALVARTDTKIDDEALRIVKEALDESKLP